MSWYPGNVQSCSVVASHSTMRWTHKTRLPSGKHTKNYGKSPFLMGKSTISMAIFHCYVSSPEGIGIHFGQFSQSKSPWQGQLWILSQPFFGDLNMATVLHITGLITSKKLKSCRFQRFQKGMNRVDKFVLFVWKRSRWNFHEFSGLLWKKKVPNIRHLPGQVTLLYSASSCFTA